MDLSDNINIKQFHFEINRFWSSPSVLPLRNVIGVIINKPTQSDIFLICTEFGVKTVKHAMETMIANHELENGQIKFSNKYIQEYEKQL